jgi:N-acetylmuramoyl-L-alanine amidase-like protein
MDRTTRRMRRIRIRSRRTKLVAGVVVAAAAVVVLAAAAFGQQGQGPAPMPKPKVEKVDLSPDPAPVDAGWEGQVGTDANLVAVQWNGDSSAQYTFEFRNADGKWLKAADSGTFDNGPDPGSKDANAGGATPQTKNVTEPVWIGRDVTGVRVRLASGSAQDVTLHVIDSTTGNKPGTNVESTSATPTTAPAPSPPSAPSPSAGGGPGATPSSTTTTQPLEGFGLGQGLAAAAIASVAVAFIVRRRRLLAVLVVSVIAVGAACAPIKPGPSGGIPNEIVPRSQWAPDLPWNWDACPGGPEYTYVANAIVHHTVNSNSYGPGDSVGLLRGIWAYHVQSLGYCDIAYNLLIDNYGVAYEGRLGGIDQPVLGAHSLNWNTGTTGIAVLGTFSSVRPSDAALGTLQDLIRWKFKVHGVNPFEVDYAHILGHRDTYSTECPGQALYDYLPATRDYVKFSW